MGRAGQCGSPELIDCPFYTGSKRFEVRLRSQECEGAQAMAIDVLEALGDTGRLLAVTADYDEPDNADQQRGKYFERVIEVEISEEELSQ